MEGSGNYRRDLGQKGEDIACRLLRIQGHTILRRNWRSGHLEIDIISLDKDGIHFVEVKTRRKNIQAPPQNNVDHRKQVKIAKAAQSFLKSRNGIPYGDHECFFDIVAVTFEEDDVKTEWIPQAFIPIYL
ncbi:MAG: YraN family protein [Bacteroidales bacterium]|nr:YraN family protein [Bacteroidales bacterium]